MESLYEKLNASSPVSAVILAIAIILLSGFLTTRITKRLKLPNVTAYIIAGIIIGPFCLNAVSQKVIDDSAFISDIALAFIAFSAGEYFRFSSFKGKGKQLVTITVLESLMASVLVFILTFFILRLGLAFSLVLSALASATAPASTLMTIRQIKAKGDFVDTLISVVAFDDIVSLLAFSVAISVATATVSGIVDTKAILLPLLYNIIMIALGVVLGLVLKFFMAKRSTDNRLIVSIALLFTLCGSLSPSYESLDGLKVDDIELNTSYINTGLFVYSVSLSIDSKKVGQKVKHDDIISAISELEYVNYVEELGC